jgi:glucokinase
MTACHEGGVILAADLGGSGLAAGLVRPTGEILSSRTVPTARRGRGEGILGNLCEILAEVGDGARRAHLPLRGIGLGLPGAVDAEAGRVGEDIPSLPELAGVPVRALLEERFGLPVAVDNDVNVLALAEWFFGVGRGCRHLALLAAGTGVGGGLIVNERLIRGAHGYGGEIGHIPVELDGRDCFCGSRGCVKAYAAGPDIAARARALAAAGDAPLLLALAGGDPARLDAPLVFAAAAQGDPAALGVTAKAAQALGAATAVLINLVNPELIVWAGGVFEAGEILIEPTRRWAARYAFPAAYRRTRILRSTFTKGSGIRGAAALFLYQAGERPRTAPPSDLSPACT